MNKQTIINNLGGHQFKIITKEGKAPRHFINNNEVTVEGFTECWDIPNIEKLSRGEMWDYIEGHDYSVLPGLQFGSARSIAPPILQKPPKRMSLVLKRLMSRVKVLT